MDALLVLVSLDVRSEILVLRCFENWADDESRAVDVRLIVGASSDALGGEGVMLDFKGPSPDLVAMFRGLLFLSVAATGSLEELEKRFPLGTSAIGEIRCPLIILHRCRIVDPVQLSPDKSESKGRHPSSHQTL
jgi:hypothetical protein